MVELTNRDKITVFLKLLGPEVAAKVLKFLPGELARLAASGIERVPLPAPAAVQSVLEEFNRYYLSAGDEVRVLPGEAKTEGAGDLFENGIRRLGLTSFWKVLAGEDLTTVAFLLAYLSPQLRQGLLNILDPGQRQTIEGLLGKVRRSPLATQIFTAFKGSLQERIEAK